MNILIIAQKDLQVLLRDRGAIFYLLLLPIVFILIWGGLGFVAAGGQADDDQREIIPVVNLDPAGEASRSLVRALDQTQGFKVVQYDKAEAERSLSRAEIWWMLVIPAGFSQQAQAGPQATLRFITHPDADTAESTRSAAVEKVIRGVAHQLSLETQIVAALQQIGEMQAASPVQSAAFTTDNYVAQARAQFESSRTRPLVTVEQVEPASAQSNDEFQFDVTNSSVAGFIVLFVFLAAQTTARSIYDEKRAGSFRRLLASPMSGGEILGGKLVANLIVTLIQIIVIFLVGMFFFQLLGFGRLTLGNDPLALVIVSLLLALCSTSLGVLIAAIARSEGQIGGLSTAFLWIAAMIGGTFMPTYVLPGVVKGLGQVVPHYWANQAYFDLLVRGQTLSGVTTEIAALAGFTVLFFAIGLWRFDFE
jgi:ABC-2 type transport system permease protein